MKPVEELKNQSDRLDYAFNYTRKNFLPIKGENSRFAYSYLNLSQSSFSAYRNGSEPSALVLRRLAEPCGFNIHWIVTGEGDMLVNDTEHLGKVIHLADEGQSIVLGRDILNGVDINVSNLRFDTMLTNDMPNTTSIGSVLLIDISTKEKEGLLVVEYNNQRVLRRVQIRSEDAFLLLTETGNSEIVPKKDVKVLGKLVWRAGKV